MGYKARQGIVLLKICGVDVLAATRQAWGECPRIRPIPRLWAAGWMLMQKGRTSDEVLNAFSNLFKDGEGGLTQKLKRAFEKLHEEGFLISAEANARMDEE